METIFVEKRIKTSTNANKRLRKAGYIPATVYGKAVDAMTISINSNDFQKLLLKTGINAIFNLEIPNEKPVTAIIKEMQNSDIKRNILHVDFQQVSLSEKIHTDVGIKIIGTEALDSNTIVVRQSEFITIKGLPQDTPDIIEIDVSGLHIGDSLKIKDIKLPEGITTENDLEQVIITIIETKLHEAEDETEDDNVESLEYS
ncbi:MAG: 50S ribosomal protein L25 [Eubacteriaceae bacterium]